MISRFILATFLAALMFVTGISTYLFENSRQSKVAVAPLKPPTVAAPHQLVLSGTLYLEQSGAIYSLSSGRFHQLTSEDGWTQPSLMPNGNILVVHRKGFYSDVFELNHFGTPIRQITNNAAPRRSYDTGDNHWSFYPRVTGDGRTLFMSYDSPKGGYEVDMSIWSMPFGGSVRQGTVWTDSYGYTGGDMQPIPVAGGIIYTKYLRALDGSIYSQIWFTNRPSEYTFNGKPLTTQQEDCREPSISPDGHFLAMICTYGLQVSNLVVAPFSNTGIGARKTVTSGQMVAEPVWAPDGSGIAYMAPAIADAPFQLWFLPSNAYFPPTPSPVPTQIPIPGGPEGTPQPSSSPSPAPPPPLVKPIQMTTGLGLDASSTLAWSA